MGDIRGVVLDEGVEDRRGRNRSETISFPLDDVSYVLVRETSPGRAFWMSLGVGAATGAALVLMALGS